jgi:hypothetical protein
MGLTQREFGKLVGPAGVGLVPENGTSTINAVEPLTLESLEAIRKKLPGAIPPVHLCDMLDEGEPRAYEVDFASFPPWPGSPYHSPCHKKVVFCNRAALVRGGEYVDKNGAAIPGDVTWH